MAALVATVLIGAAAWLAGASLSSVRAHADTAPLVATQPATFRPVPEAARPVPLPMGGWTPDRGRMIAERALRWLNWPYAWDGGDAAGPTFGRAVDYDSRNDGGIRGFDCSGLVLYAVAPWRQVSHSASAQYREVGSFHPTLDSLYPGDIVFWSTDGTVGGIEHVAIYVGNGYVVQAPHSGDVIRVTPLFRVQGGTMGATRPLT